MDFISDTAVIFRWRHRLRPFIHDRLDGVGYSAGFVKSALPKMSFVYYHRQMYAEGNFICIEVKGYIYRYIK